MYGFLVSRAHIMHIQYHVINTRKIPILAALEHMVENTYMCRYSLCFDIIDVVSS